MAQTINSLKAALGPGARANKYLFTLSTPNGITDLELLCRSTSFPTKNIGQVEVFNQGRKTIYQGETAFDHTWEVTFYETEAHKVRSEMIKWMDLIDNAETNDHNEGFGASSAIITQLDGKGNETATYEFVNIWPQTVDQVDVGQDTNDAIAEISVTFSFDSWHLVS